MENLLPRMTDGRIMIIDDDANTVFLVRKVLEKSGYANVAAFTDPLVAMESFLRIAPDLVILDINMQQLNGIEVLHGICCLIAEEKRPPILVMTGNSKKESMHAVLDAGATEFVTKPLDCSEIIIRVQHLLQMRCLALSRLNYSQSLETVIEDQAHELEAQKTKIDTVLEALRASQQLVQETSDSLQRTN